MRVHAAVVAVSLALPVPAAAFDCTQAPPDTTSALLVQVFVREGDTSAPLRWNGPDGPRVCVYQRWKGVIPDCVADANIGESGFLLIEGLPDGDYRVDVIFPGFARPLDQKVRINKEWPARLLAVELGIMCSGSCSVSGSGRGPLEKAPACLKESGTW